MSMRKSKRDHWTVAFTLANGRTVYPNDFNKSAQIVRFTPNMNMAKVASKGEIKRLVSMTPPGAKAKIVSVIAA